MKYIVGAYVTSPCLFKWNESDKNKYFDGLKAIENIRGLEHPFWGTLHPFDDDWFLNNIDPSWDFVFTCIPGTMKELLKNPDFGLASKSPAGRNAALEFTEKTRQAIIKTNKHTNRNSVIAVQLHSAPHCSVAYERSAVSSFVLSLEEITSWDWQNARIVIEHCDAPVSGHSPEKGFLSIDDEIKAILKINQRYQRQKLGMTINWGRSAIEGRHPDTAIEHITKAKRAGLLSGIMFSGCSDRESPYGVWKDTHMPPPREYDSRFFAEKSLMTAKRMQKALETADFRNLDYFGIKIMALPENADNKRRIGLNSDTVKLLNIITRFS